MSEKQKIDQDYDTHYAPENEHLWAISVPAGVHPLEKFTEEGGAKRLHEACCGYFEYIDNNPIYVEKLFSNKDGVIRTYETHIKPYTKQGLAVMVGVNEKIFPRWIRNRPDLKPVIQWALNIVFTQKFEGAAVGLFNAALISNDLKGEYEHNDPDEDAEIDQSPVDVEEIAAFDQFFDGEF